jgi:protease-4
VASAFRQAIEDKEVRAILFRIDSPGGSYVASDTIWQETVRARKTGKPVIASMGNVAGSGGYFVAMAADKIVAQPGTITGSIGVLGGKMLTTGFWQKLGITWDEVHEGANATFWTGTSDYTPAQWARFQAWLDRIYDDFTSKVAEGRRLPKQRVLEIAKGRIWTGEDAKALGLVDELGGFDVALRLAKQAAGIPEKEEVRLKLFPPRKSLLEVIMERLTGREPQEEEAGMVALRRALELVQPFARRVRMLDAARAPLAMPWP